MKRRTFLAALGLAPVLAKLGLATEAPVAPPPIPAMPLGPPTYNGVPFTYTTSLDGAPIYSEVNFSTPRFYAINASYFTPRMRWKLQDRARRVAARTLKAS